MNFDTLYILSQNKDILTWKISVHNGGAASTVTTTSGTINGKQSANTYTVVRGKNLGKKNATTHFTQALQEAETIYNNKISKGYRSLKMLGLNNDITNTHLLLTRLDVARKDGFDNLKPMLCQPFKADKIKYPRYGQPKINGTRGFIKISTFDNGLFGIETKVSITSKEGLLFNIPHLEENETIKSFIQVVGEHIKPYDKTIEDVILDCELYVPHYTCAEIAGACKNDKNPINNKIIAILLDLAIDRIYQKNRLAIISEVHKVVSNLDNYNILGFPSLFTIDANVFYRVSNTKITCDKEAIVYRDKFIDEGYEGIVLRDANAFYKFGQRPSTIHKFKAKQSSEFTVLDIVLQDKRDLPKFVLKNDINNLTFELNASGKHNDQIEILNNKEDYIGYKVMVEFHERTKNGLPLHCIYIGLRNE